MSIYKNIRKIVVGDSFANAIKYVKGSQYNLGQTKAKISDIIESEDDTQFLDIFIEDKDNDCTVYWKSVRKDKILESESDVNFE